MRITIINCFDVYDHRAELLQKVLQGKGHQVTVLIPNFRHIQKCARVRSPEGFEMLPVRPYYSTYSLTRIQSHMRFAQDAVSRAEQLAPDLLWVMVPPNSLVKSAAAYKKRRPAMRLVLDFMDLWPESMPQPGFAATLPGRMWRGLRDKYVNAADSVVTECSSYWDVLQKSCGRQKLHTLYVPRNQGLSRPKARLPADKIALCFLGQINRDLDLQAIGGLIQKLDRPTEVHVIGDGTEKALLCRTIEEAGATAVFHHEIYAQEKKREIFDSCHAGLNLLKTDAGSGLTMKSVDYLEASLPVINNVRGDIWEFVERYPVGLNYEEHTRITAANLLALQSRREQVQALYDAYFAERVFSVKLRDIVGAGP